MYVYVSCPSGSRVDVLVGHSGGHDQDLAVLRLDCLVAYRKGNLALLDHEHLRVRMGVQVRASSHRGVDKEERDVRATMQVPSLDNVGHALLPCLLHDRSSASFGFCTGRPAGGSAMGLRCRPSNSQRPCSSTKTSVARNWSWISCLVSPSSYTALAVCRPIITAASPWTRTVTSSHSKAL